ncbi:MAG: hypothetical protein IM610_17120, partial [Cytophagales bacterium]|nr:hypothetical protein [Cytophagales bacterium]
RSFKCEFYDHLRDQLLEKISELGIFVIPDRNRSDSRRTFYRTKRGFHFSKEAVICLALSAGEAPVQEAQFLAKIPDFANVKRALLELAVTFSSDLLMSRRQVLWRNVSNRQLESNEPLVYDNQNGRSVDM